MKSITRILTVLAAAFMLFGTVTDAAAQSSTAGIQRIIAAQDATVGLLAERLNPANREPAYLVARDVKALAESVLALQAAEEKAYKLSDVRDAAGQTMTTTAITRGLEEAKALGVSRSLRENIYTEWKAARTIDEADQAVSKVNLAIADRLTVVADRGTFRRLLPDWMGGTSSYANYSAPQRSGDAVLARLQALERKMTSAPILGTAQAPAAVK